MGICEIRARTCFCFSLLFLWLKLDWDSLQACFGLVLRTCVQGTKVIGASKFKRLVIPQVLFVYWSLIGHWNPLKSIETIPSSHVPWLPWLRSVPSAFDLLHPESALLVRSLVRLGLPPPICSFAAMGSIPFLGGMKMDELFALGLRRKPSNLLRFNMLKLATCEREGGWNGLKQPAKYPPAIHQTTSALGWSWTMCCLIHSCWRVPWRKWLRRSLFWTSSASTVPHCCEAWHLGAQRVPKSTGCAFDNCFCDGWWMLYTFKYTFKYTFIIIYTFAIICIPPSLM